MSHRSDQSEIQTLLDSFENSKSCNAHDKQRIIDILNELERRDKFGGYNRWFVPGTPYGIENLPKHRAFFEAGATYDERFFCAGNRCGKALSNNELVHTPSGPVKMGSLSVGDFVTGSDGYPTKVIGYFPQGERDVYRVQCSDGSSVLCDIEHLWEVRVGTQKSSRLLTTKELMAQDKRCFLPQRPVVQYPYRDLPIDPYLCGLLIGDGTLLGTLGSVYISSKDQEIIDYCKDIAALYECSLQKRGDCTYQFVSRVNNFHGNSYNILGDLVRGAGLACTSYYKSIPEEYLVSGKEQRLSLLQGLMDTDGYCGKNGTSEFYSVSLQLCKDVERLAKSLGFNCVLHKKLGRYKGKQHISYRVRFSRSPHMVPFRLTRKVANYSTSLIKERSIYIESIEPAGREECSCIKVEASDGLFVAGDFVVTHNTLAGAYEMACHLTGEYPSWWRGREFDHAIAAWACGKTSKVTRDSVQKELLGEDGIGSGMIPRDKIIKVWAKPGTPRGIETVEIRHVSGGTSSLTFKSYEEGVQSFYGTARHVLWMDEEADEYIYSECFLRTATTGGLIYTTFTPKHGITPFVLSFFKNADFLAGSPKILFTEQEMNDG